MFPKLKLLSAMFPTNQQLPIYQRPLSIQLPPITPNAGQSDHTFTPRDDVQTGRISPVESVVYTSKKLQDDLESLGLKIKRHEENIKFLKSQKNALEDSVLDMQVTLGNYHSRMHMDEDEDHSHDESGTQTVDNIIKHEKSAAGILCKLKSHHGTQASQLPLTKDVVGIVATLGKVNDDSLSRLLSEYLGLEAMLAIVCKTNGGVKALETYEKDGSIIRSSGLHGLGASIGRQLEGRFLVICLENLRPYCGDFIADDPQRRLDIPKPKLANGDTPPGFLGYAVNMVDIDTANLCYLTANGHGLRETLFYNLFLNLQVYRTRLDMSQALACVRNGAVSLDGGIMKTAAMFSLGNREEIDVKFEKNVTSKTPSNYYDIEKRMQSMKWRQQKYLEDMQREQALLDQAMSTFSIKKEEFVKFLADYGSQYSQAVRGFTPR